MNRVDSQRLFKFRRLFRRERAFIYEWYERVNSMPWLRTRLVRYASRLVFAILISAIISQFTFDSIEAFFYDLRIQLRPAPAPSGMIETIVIDPETITRAGRAPDSVDHTRLVRTLREAGAAAIIYLIQPTELIGALDDLMQFADEARQTPGFFVAVNDLAMRGETDPFPFPAPFRGLSAQSAPVTSDRAVFARDDVTRSMFISYQGFPTLHPLIAQNFNSDIADLSKIRGQFSYLESVQVHINFRPTHTYPKISLAAFLDPGLDTSRFRNKIVIVGRDIQTTSKDYVRTPYSRDVVAMSLVELHANMFDTLIRNDAPRRGPGWLDDAFTTIIALITVGVVLSLRPARGMLILAATIIGFSSLAFLLLWLGSIWIGMAHPLLAVFICYYFFIPYRLIMENRRSWEYFHKHRLLSQVEELKTNFLSMMSHDLKTPIARIQGMADVVAGDDANPLSSRQSEALATLRRSADELLEFISSVLSLTRIESKEIQLHIASWDVNALIREVVHRLEDVARARNIEVLMELEPLFSVRIDAGLMRQVFFNLLENALKYSDGGSKVLISSEEADGLLVVQFADQGQGIPEDEIPHIFEKFYRSRNAKASPTKGTGLGLYLARYFVELHHGQIYVDSRVGQGTTFAVELPMNGSSDFDDRH